jgi:hypothetical protein
VLDRDFVLRVQSSAVDDLKRGNFSLPGVNGAVLHPVGKWAAAVKLPEFLYKTAHSECRYLKYFRFYEMLKLFLL